LQLLYTISVRSQYLDPLRAKQQGPSSRTSVVVRDMQKVRI
jgi:hypothetical protein